MFSLRSFWGWTLALVCSVLLNVSLFGLMPRLIQGVPHRPEALEELHQVQVIRVNRTLPPPPKKKPVKPKEIKPVTPEAHQTPRKMTSLPKQMLNPQLPFDLNPKLPEVPMDLVMPGLEHFAMDGPVLKDSYTMGELDSPLTPLVKMPPIYPLRATRRGIEGSVTVEFIVTERGLVEQIRILASNPDHIFDKSVTRCLALWKFKPGTVEGLPVATLVQTTIRFKLEK
jgi:periplasmic protein TonB